MIPIKCLKIYRENTDDAVMHGLDPVRFVVSASTKATKDRGQLEGSMPS